VVGRGEPRGYPLSRSMPNSDVRRVIKPNVAAGETDGIVPRFIGRMLTEAFAKKTKSRG